MRLFIKKWGNSASVRIPAAIMDATGLRLDQAVEVRAQDGCVLISPVAPAGYELASLLDAITLDNLHGAVETGPAVGQETP